VDCFPGIEERAEELLWGDSLRLHYTLLSKDRSMAQPGWLCHEMEGFQNVFFKK
jgi:hypothetical protein